MKSRPKFELETLVPNTFVRHELRKNMGNLPTRWKGIAISDDVNALSKSMGEQDRIIDRATGKVVKLGKNSLYRGEL